MKERVILYYTLTIIINSENIYSLKDINYELREKYLSQIDVTK